LSRDLRLPTPTGVAEIVSDGFRGRIQGVAKLRHCIHRELVNCTSSSRNAVSFSCARTTKRFASSRCASAIQIVRPRQSIAETQPQLQPALLRLSAMISQFFIRFRAIALMIMPVVLNCGFEFEKGRQFLVCFYNKASGVAALCGHNPNWSAFAIRGRHRAAIPSSVAEIFEDDLPILHGCPCILPPLLFTEQRQKLPSAHEQAARVQRVVSVNALQTKSRHTVKRDG
jgi:hypothetical protein